MSTDESSELYQFSEFLAGKLSAGDESLTPEQCLELWRLEHPTRSQYADSVKSIQSAIDEMEDGTSGVSVDELHSRLRSKYLESNQE